MSPPPTAPINAFAVIALAVWLVSSILGALAFIGWWRAQAEVERLAKLNRALHAILSHPSVARSSDVCLFISKRLAEAERDGEKRT